MDGYEANRMVDGVLVYVAGLLTKAFDEALYEKPHRRGRPPKKRCGRPPKKEK